MPYVDDASSTSSSRAAFEDGFSQRCQPLGQHIVSDNEYAATVRAGTSERPLSEQLEPIAVCGMGCRLPGDVKSATDFWDMMINKGSGSAPRVPPSRFRIDAHLHANNDRPGSFNVPGGYFLNETLKEFDPTFFNLTPIEAMWMDPQQRKLLEVVYECFESAGVTLDDVSSSKTAVFVASFTSDFQQMAFKEPSFRHSLAATGVDPGIIPNRISHVFNLTGPSVHINTACSSSLYAIHNACNALRNEECVAAVVGGVNLILAVDQHANTAKLGVLSPTSTCHTFDASADGYGRAEGVGAVYLKRLDDAIRDGDPVRAVIRSSANNTNGRAPAVGITYPGREGQVEVIKHAYARAGQLDPLLTGYFECHGTGTAVGDPIEVQAVSVAMNNLRIEEDGPLVIGAVKPNIGHSEAASGLSAVIKAVLIAERAIIPPTRGVAEPSRAIKWKDWRVTVNDKLIPFPALPVRRVSINSFGYGGTNAHVIVEAAESLLVHTQSYTYMSPLIKRKKVSRSAFDRCRPYMLPFSAHDRAALKRNIAAHGQIAPYYKLGDLAHTLSDHRTAFSSRAFAVVTYDELTKAFDEGLQSWTFGEKSAPPTIGFVFTGQGAQWPRMGEELMKYYPSFQHSIRKMDNALGELTDGPEWSLEDILLTSADASPIHEAEFAQPCCTAIQIALVQLLRDWGIEPKVVVGHSSGEIAAACTAGFITASEAIILAYLRGKIVKDIHDDGAMLAVGLGADDVQPFIREFYGRVGIACHNSPTSVTLSGDASVICQLEKEFMEKKIFARSLKTGGKAYHSHHMAAVASSYETAFQTARHEIPFELPYHSDIKMISSVTNSILAPGAKIDENYFSSNLKQPVLFNQAIQTLATLTETADVDLLVEIGPHSALAGPIRQIRVKHQLPKIEYLPSLLRGQNSAVQLLRLAGELFLRGAQIDMARIASLEVATVSDKIVCKRGSFIVDLPTYQWSTKTYWAESRQSAEHRASKYSRHDLLGSVIPGGSLTQPTWRNVLRICDVPWLKDHSIGGEAIYPFAGYLSMAMEAITQIIETSTSPSKITSYTFRDISIAKALVTPDTDNGIEVLLSMRHSRNNGSNTKITWWEFRVSSIDSAGIESDHMIGDIAINAKSKRPLARRVPHLPQRASGKAWNQALREVGLDYGRSFADMDNIAFDGKTYIATSTSKLKTESGTMIDESRHVIHPSTIDSVMQLMLVSVYAGRTKAMNVGIVPVQVDEICIWAPTTAQIESSSAFQQGWCTERGDRHMLSSGELTAEDGQVLIEISNMRAVSFEAAVPQKALMIPAPKPYGRMVWQRDVDSLHLNNASAEKLTLNDILKLSAFKKPSVSILDLGAKYHKILHEVMDLRYTGIVSTSDDLQNLQTEIATLTKARIQLLDVQTDTVSNQVLGDELFDLVVTDRCSYIDIAARSVSQNGKVISTGDIGDEALLSHGLSPLVRSKDFTISRVVSTVELPDTESVPQQIQLVYREASPMLDQIRASLAANGFTILSTELSKIDQWTANVVVVDDGQPILASSTKEDFLAIRGMIDNASTLLWVSAGGLMSGKSPEAGLIAGLLRSVKNEQASISTVTVDVNLDNTHLTSAAGFVVETTIAQITKATDIEREYSIADNDIHITRLLPDTQINSCYSPRNDELKKKAFSPADHISGVMRSGKIVFKSSAPADLAANDVEIKIAYTGLTTEGVLVMNGNDSREHLSHEITGTVERVGNAVLDLTLGDRVVGFSFDSFSTYQQVDASLVRKVSADEDLAVLATLPMVYGTAVYGLKMLAKLRASETVLILAGTGAAGSAAVELAKVIGAVVYVVASSEAQATAISTLYGLPAEQVIVTSAEMSSSIREGLRAFDVVISSGRTELDLAHHAWRFIAPFGRFIDIGRKNVLERSALDTAPLARGASYHSFDIVDLYKHKPDVLSEILDATITAYRDGLVANVRPPVIISITGLDEVVSNFNDDFENATNVISYSAEPCQNIDMIPTKPSLQFRSDATYLLVGCLGGLGRSLTMWMMSKGARYFAFLSRSGADAKSAAILVEKLESAGAGVQIIRGDVANLDDVQRAISSIPANRPIRGVINAAMVLRDGLFHNMTYENWQACIGPKVQGSANLHAALGDTPLDFFLMTSSVSGILGTPGQANYAAANAYLDALAHHRRMKGLKACAAIIPMVLGIGVVSENTDLEQSLKRKGMYGIDEEHLLESFEVAIASQTNNSIDHLVIGMDPYLLHKAVQETSEDCNNFYKDDPRFSAIVASMNDISTATKNLLQSSTADAQNIIKSIKFASTITTNPETAIKIAQTHLQNKLARILLLDEETFTQEKENKFTKSIASYGIDSMIGAELRNWIFKEFGGLDMSFSQLLSPGLTTWRFGEVVCEFLGIESVRS